MVGQRSHATHDDCQGHMGAMMSLGKGATISFSNQLKVNTKSSTESELIGANQALSSILHTHCFIKAQGYSIEQNILFQDNQLTMHLEVNGSFSSSKHTKHIKCRFFFIQDKLDDGNLEVIYCPTKIMWADVLTKPRQGEQFCLNRSILMNIPINYDDDVKQKLTHLLLFPKDKQKHVINQQAHQAPLIHPRSVLGTNLPDGPQFCPTNRFSMTHLVRPVTPLSPPPLTSLVPGRILSPCALTWADQVKIPIATK
jgi:hypothetical protein